MAARDIFFHVSRLAEGLATDLRPGTRVLYELGMDRAGKMAASSVRIAPSSANNAIMRKPVPAPVSPAGRRFPVPGISHVRQSLGKTAAGFQEPARRRQTIGRKHGSGAAGNPHGAARSRRQFPGCQTAHRKHQGRRPWARKCSPRFRPPSKSSRSSTKS